MEAFETAVHGLERELAQTQGPLWTAAIGGQVDRCRSIRRKLTAEQARDARYADLSRRLDDAEHLRRTGGNPLGDLQARIGAALARLSDDPDSALKTDLLALLLPHPEDREVSVQRSDTGRT